MKIKSKLTPHSALLTPHYLPGQMLIIGILFMVVILILSASLFSRVANFVRFGSNNIMRDQATALAEAGVEKALWQLNETVGAYTGEADTAVGTTGTFTVTVTDKAQNIKTITATSFVPNSTDPKAKRTIKVDAAIDNEQIAFNYAVQSDTGGFTMGSSARVNGNVYSNGNITGGSSSVISGDAFAVGTISSPHPTVTGIKDDNAPSIPLPAVDETFWKTAANGGNDPSTCPPETCTNGNVNLSGIQSYGPRKIKGNLTTSSSAIITITGPIYVTGSVTFGSSTIINLDNSFGSNGTVIIADGAIEFGSSTIVNPTTASPKGYLMFVSLKSTGIAIDQGSSARSGILYAPNAQVHIGSSTRVVALAAKSIDVGSSAILDYDQGLASAQFSGGPGGAWAVRKGTYRFTQ